MFGGGYAAQAKKANREMSWTLHNVDQEVKRKKKKNRLDEHNNEGRKERIGASREHT